MDLKRDRWNFVQRGVETYFSEYIVAKIRRLRYDFAWGPGAGSIADHIENSVAVMIPEDLGSKYPKDVNDFVGSCGHFFSPNYLRHFSKRIDYFNKIVSGTSLKISDDMIHQLPCSTWILRIARASAYYDIRLWESRFPETPVVPQVDGTADLGPSQTPPSPTTSIWLPKLDGTTEAGPSQTQPSPMTSPPATRAAISQIYLKGSSIKVAWNNNPRLRQLENAANVGPHWSPENLGGLWVYHSTAAHLRPRELSNFESDRPGADELEAFQQNFSHSPFSALKNRYLPDPWSSFPCTFTGFSPIRCFLWAVFHSEVVENVPGPLVEQNHLQKKWLSGGVEYQGVVLFQFRGRQPGPDGQSHFTIPMGKEELWAAKSKTFPTISWTDRRTMWNKFQDIHGQNGGDWPDILHAYALPTMKNQYKDFTEQHWMSVWFGDVAVLNQHDDETFAISFQLEASTTLWDDRLV